MLRILDLAPSLGAASHRQRCFSSSVWPPLTTLRTMWEALREGLAVQRQYEELRSKGFAHDAALQRALAIGPALPQPARDERNKKHCALRAACIRRTLGLAGGITSALQGKVDEVFRARAALQAENLVPSTST